MGGTSYNWTLMQEGPNDCMVGIIWTMLTFGIKAYILASVCV